jgi:membrane-bound lytic murein transglycosylase D
MAAREVLVCTALVLLSPATFAAGEPHVQPQARPRTQPTHTVQARPDPNVRRQVAGGPTAEEASQGVESPELAQLRAAERELFPPAAPLVGSAWPTELPTWREPHQPEVHTSGLPAPPPVTHGSAEGTKDVSWLAHLTLPDLPVRWDPRVVRYLELYRDDARARGALIVWRKRAGRYKDVVERVLRRKNLPVDLLWLAMIESGFDATARSPAGAVGLWQFMPETGRTYGLPQDRFVDERVDVAAATESAADFLSDLHRRFGSWELAMASYNMGYAGIVSAARRYNTNDFWQLSKLEGSLPWETTLYVPKIIAAAIVMRNPHVFGLDTIPMDPAMDFDEVRAPFGVALQTIAQAAGASVKDVEALNPELRASRTPPKESEVAQAVLGQGGSGGVDRGWPVRVPQGKGALVAAALAKLKHDDIALERYVVRFGETLEQVAQAHGTTSAKLSEINAIASGELVRGGTVLFVPHGTPAVTERAPSTTTEKPVVIVPTDLFVYPGRKRVFYKVVVGDTVKELADAMHVTVDDLRRWNDIDPSARLIEGMTLQAFVPEGTDLSRITLLAEKDVKVLPVGSDELFAYFEKNKHRFVVTAHTGETLEAVGKRFGLTGGLMERINRRPRSDVLRDGESIVVYTATNQPAPPAPSVAVASVAPGVPTPLDPLPAPPRPDLLP